MTMFGLMPYERRARGMMDLFNEMENSFFRDSGVDTALRCRTDIQDQGDSYLLSAELPGFKKEDIHVDIQNGYLTISAERHSEDEKKDSKGNVIHSERSFGSFSRSFNLSGIDEDKITASYKDGVLALTMPKANQTVPETRRLEIQ